MTQARFDSQKIRSVLFQKLSGGIELKTPSGAEFEVQKVEKARLILRVGKNVFSLYLRLSCLDELVKECNQLLLNQWMRIGAVHGTPSSGTLDSIVQKYTGRTSAASYLAIVIQIDDYDYQKINIVPCKYSYDVTCAYFLTQS